ncbi:hypothetical protein ABIE67_001425 [Streptomyces sp. V4I8]|uniref:hypothetical protein n=1 Tax=Streptomyces sp. V4I8 TaxID=3156469 RepID=UPI0035122F6D
MPSKTGVARCPRSAARSFGGSPRAHGGGTEEHVRRRAVPLGDPRAAPARLAGWWGRRVRGYPVYGMIQRMG